jgi:hypothetical protein
MGISMAMASGCHWMINFAHDELLEQKFLTLLTSDIGYRGRSL